MLRVHLGGGPDATAVQRDTTGKAVAAVMAGVLVHSVVVVAVVVTGASQRWHEAKDSRSALRASSAGPQAESMTTRPGPQTRSQILLDRHKTRRTCWPGTYGNSRCNDKSTVSSQYSRDAGDTRMLSLSARSRRKASPDACSSTRPWRPATVRFSRYWPAGYSGSAAIVT